MRRICLMALGACLAGAAAEGGWPFSASGEPRRGSEEWFAAHSEDPVGARQKYLFGKVWPTRPRPAGPHQHFIHKFHAAHAWPYPYVCDDRRDVHACMDTQVTNGWIEATTLYDYHFDDGTQELNQAGVSHLEWIVSHVPAEYRQTHIASTANPEFNNVRLLSVQKAVSSLAGDNGLQIASRVTHSVGRPAAEVQAIHESRLTNALPPIISYQSEVGGGGGSGGGGGGGGGGGSGGM